jgi:flagellar motor protein MotB
VRWLARSAGDFVADNRTAAGRAKNRRVEIHFG